MSNNTRKTVRRIIVIRSLAVEETIISSNHKRKKYQYSYSREKTRYLYKNESYQNNHIQKQGKDIECSQRSNSFSSLFWAFPFLL